ncbi:MAG: CBS domain-containing protein [Anaerolineales bacterium]|nr:CBS domain-containing protein [Anaerolineales bacterium]
MKTIGSLLEKKGSRVWSVKPDTVVFEALKLMADKDVGALVVMEENKLVGLISERDYARKVILHGKCSKDTPVSNIMTYNLITTTPEQTIEQGLELMSKKHVRHLPVIENDELIGIVSIGDLVVAIIAEQKRLIHRLEQIILENQSLA